MSTRNATKKRPPRDRRVTAPWVRVAPDRGTHGTPTGFWSAILMDGKVGVSGAVDSCPWAAAERVCQYALSRGFIGAPA